MSRWRDLVVVNKEYIRMMASMKPNGKNEADLWNIVAIQIIALSVNYDIPLQSDVSAAVHQGRLSFSIENSQSLQHCEPLLKSILVLLESKKKSTVYAVSEVIGQILQKQPELTNILREFISAKLSTD